MNEETAERLSWRVHGLTGVKVSADEVRDWFGSVFEEGKVQMREALRNRLWDAIAEVRDDSPRLSNDADTDDIVLEIEPIIESYARVYAAEQIRKLAHQRSFQENTNLKERLLNRAAEIEAGLL